MRSTLDDPIVTVVTPTYNRRDFLRQTLASVHLQTHPAVEHIVIDAGSTDGSVELLERARDLWGIRFVSQPDRGMYDAINKGIALSNGSIIGWLNSDDWLLPWALQTVVETIGDNSRPAAVYGDAVTVDYGSSVGRIAVYPRFRYRDLRNVSTLPQPTVYWTKAAGDLAGLLDTGRYQQIADCEYWLRMGKYVPIRKYREISAIVNNHNDTKRVTLQAQIASEFQALRTDYADRSTSSKSFSALRWRCATRFEVSSLVLRRGWARSYASSALDFEFEHERMLRAAIRNSPVRRHPTARLRVAFQDYRRSIDMTASQLD